MLETYGNNHEKQSFMWEHNTIRESLFRSNNYHTDVIHEKTRLTLVSNPIRKLWVLAPSLCNLAMTHFSCAWESSIIPRRRKRSLGESFHALFKFASTIQAHTHNATRTFELFQSFEHAIPFGALRTKFKANALKSLDTFWSDLSLAFRRRRRRKALVVRLRTYQRDASRGFSSSAITTIALVRSGKVNDHWRSNHT